MTEKLKQIRNFISEKISQDEFKIVDYDNSFKIHSNECDRDVSLHDMNGKLTLYIDAYTQNIPSIAYISIFPDCIQVKFWVKITMY